MTLELERAHWNCDIYQPIKREYTRCGTEEERPFLRHRRSSRPIATLQKHAKKGDRPNDGEAQRRRMVV